MRKLLLGLGAVLAILAVLVAGFLALAWRGDLSYETLEARYGSEASRYVDIGDVRIHYREEGDPSGRTILLIHGFSASLHTWAPWVERLAPRYRVISLDLPGHGLTRAPADFTPSTQAYADLVAAFAAELNLPPVVVAGSSMGGHVAWDFARRHPEKVAALALVDAGGWLDENAEDGDVFALLRDPFWGPILMKLDSTALTRQGLQAAFVDPTLVTEEMVQRYVTLARAPGRRAILRRLLTELDLYTLATPELMASIQAPTLVMHGDRDALVPVESGRRFAQTNPNAQLVIFENVGHIPQEEIPDRSVETLIAFLDGALPSDPTAGIGQPLGVDPGTEGRPLVPGAAPKKPALEGVY